MHDNCKHRWEETDYGRKYLNEGTVVYMCRRCNEARLVSLAKKETPDASTTRLGS